MEIHQTMRFHNFRDFVSGSFSGNISPPMGVTSEDTLAVWETQTSPKSRVVKSVRSTICSSVLIVLGGSAGNSSIEIFIWLVTRHSTFLGPLTPVILTKPQDNSCFLNFSNTRFSESWRNSILNIIPTFWTYQHHHIYEFHQNIYAVDCDRVTALNAVLDRDHPSCPLSFVFCFICFGSTCFVLSYLCGFLFSLALCCSILTSSCDPTLDIAISTHCPDLGASSFFSFLGGWVGGGEWGHPTPPHPNHATPPQRFHLMEWRSHLMLCRSQLLGVHI